MFKMTKLDRKPFVKVKRATPIDKQVYSEIKELFDQKKLSFNDVLDRQKLASVLLKSHVDIVNGFEAQANEATIASLNLIFNIENILKIKRDEANIYKWGFPITLNNNVPEGNVYIYKGDRHIRTIKLM